MIELISKREQCLIINAWLYPRLNMIRNQERSCISNVLYGDEAMEFV